MPRLRLCVVWLDRKPSLDRLTRGGGASLSGHRPGNSARWAVLKQIATQDEAVLEVVDVGDIDRNVIVVEDGELAVGGRFSESDLKQVGRFRISDADRESLIGVGDDHVLHLDDLRQRG